MSKVFTIADGLENLGALRTGGQGSVYKGKRMGAIYSAIKLIPTPIHTEDDTDKNYRNFKNEVTKLQKVNENPSPNVVKILSWGITDSGSFPYIEMEFIEGPDICELLQPPHPKAFNIKELVKIADQLAGALQHCHSVGVKHGDIKSNNVKYNVHTGNFVLLDFGLAIMSEEQRRTSIRHAGAIEFMAPEQHEGKMLLQTDIYSYGIILYELLTGQVPFPLNGDGDTGRNVVMLGHMEGNIPDALNLRRQNLEGTLSKEALITELHVPDWLLAIIYKCLKKDPYQRFADGVELANAVTAGMLLLEKEKAVEGEQPIDTSLKQRRQPENEQAAIYKKGYINVPKKAFIAAMAITLIVIALLSYAAFTKKEVVVNTTAVPITTHESPLLTYDKQYYARLMKAREDSINLARAKTEQALKQKDVDKKEDKKKKRKKFLGIF